MPEPNGRPFPVSLIGSGFLARGLSHLLAKHDDFELSKVLTRRPADGTTNYGLSVDNNQITNSIDEVIDSSALVIECSGDAVHATAVLSRVMDAGLPVVTMDAELHVTTGSWLAKKGFITEAEGDQPGSIAALREDALNMGFTPVVYGNVKGFLNHTPTREDMLYWSERNGISLMQVTSFTDGTKVHAEQVLVANGFGAQIAQDGLLGYACDTLEEGGVMLAEKAAEQGVSLSDYILPKSAPPGVFVVGTHDEIQAPYLRYYKLGEGPYYVLVRPYHLCHFEVIKTIRRVLDGRGVLLNNSTHPTVGLAAIAKKAFDPGDIIPAGIGSFDVRGSAVKIHDNVSHVPIGLVQNAVVKQAIEPGEMITFDHVDLPDTLALQAWYDIRDGVLHAALG